MPVNDSITDNTIPLTQLQKKYGNVFFWLWWSIFPISYLLGSNWDSVVQDTIEA
jgi:hypothetical protein